MYNFYRAEGALLQMASDTLDPRVRSRGSGIVGWGAQAGVAENHVLLAITFSELFEARFKKSATYDFSKIKNLDAQASELSEKPPHVMVIIFSSISKNYFHLGKDTILGIPKYDQILIQNPGFSGFDPCKRV